MEGSPIPASPRQRLHSLRDDTQRPGLGTLLRTQTRPVNEKPAVTASENTWLEANTSGFGEKRLPLIPLLGWLDGKRPVPPHKTKQVVMDQAQVYVNVG